MNDKRLSPRLPFKSRLRYRVIREADFHKYYSTEDVSRGGICFVVGEPLRVGSVLEILVELENSAEPVHAIVEIVWIKKLENGEVFKVGSKFIIISDYDKSNILELAFNQWAIGVTPLP